MSASLRSTAAAALGLAVLTISGCGGGSPTPSPSPSPSPSTSPAPSPTPSTPQPIATTTTTTTTTGAHETSIWAWRKDLDHGVEITYDLSGDMEHSIYGGCWRDGGVDTVGEHNVEGNVTFVELAGETGLTLHNKRAHKHVPGCLMRKSRLQVDLSVIGRMELDVNVTGQGTEHGKAPWYSVWLVPMNYSKPDCNEKAAEIDLLENYDDDGRGGDVSGCASNFAQCGIYDYTAAFCQSVSWPEAATEINHHITLKAHMDPEEGRIIEVRRCLNTGATMETCEDGEFSQIKVQKPNPDVPDWFPIWNKTLIGDNYAKYWLAADMWWTSNTNFTLSVDNVRFFHDDDTEWKMPLDYGDAGATSMEAKPEAFAALV